MRFGTRFVLLLVLLCATTSAYGLITDPEQRRGDLNQFVQELSGVEGFALDPVEADRVIQGMDDTEVAAMHQGLNSFGPWREIPVVMASLAEGREQFEREKLARALSEVGAPGLVNDDRRRLENFRADFLFLIDQLAAFGPLADDHYRNQAAWLRADIERMPIEAVAALEARYIERALEIQMILTGCTRRSTPLPRATAVWCVMNHIFSDIADFFIALPGHAQNALDQITGIFTSVAGAFASGASGLVNQVINELGLNSIDWAAVASAADTYARLPCPPNGMLLPGFGTVGEIRTATNYNGTVGFAGNAIQDLLPSDILTSADIQAIAQVLNFPVQWLGTCLQGAYDDRFDTAQSTHRDHVTTNLDVVASTRASQASLDSVQAQENDLDADVVMIEATTGRTIVLLDRLETTTERLDGKSDDLESKIENLQLQQGQTSGQLEEMQESMLRMFIETDLFGNGTARIGLFQIPAAQGGFLDLVVQIVEETIASREAAGVNMKRAEKEYAAGLEQQAFGNYKDAYELLRAAYRKAVN